MNPYDNARRQTDWATAVRRVGLHAQRAGANWHGRQLCPRSPLVTGVPSSHHGSDEQMLAPRTRRSPCDLRPAAAGGAGGWESDGLRPQRRQGGNVAKVCLAAITAGAGTASVLLSTGTGSSAPASPRPSEGRFNLLFFGQRPAFFGQPFG
jgi:hypothetical protein